MEFKQTRKRSNSGLKTSVNITEKQARFFEENPLLTKKTCWDFGVFMIMAAINKTERQEITIGFRTYEITIREV